MNDFPAPVESRVSSVGRPALVSTIRWTRVEDGLPPFGAHVAVWMPSLSLVMRAYLDGRDGTSWKLPGIDRKICVALIAAWANLPSGVLPPPDGAVSAAEDLASAGLTPPEREILDARLNAAFGAAGHVEVAP